MPGKNMKCEGYVWICFVHDVEEQKAWSYHTVPLSFFWKERRRDRL